MNTRIKTICTWICLAVLTATGIGTTVLAADDGGQTWDWEKTHSSGGRLTIQTSFVYPGEILYEDGTSEEVYLRILQDYEGFFLNLFNPEQHMLWNSGEASLPAVCRFVWYEGTDREYVQEFRESMAAGSCVVPLSQSSQGIAGVGVMQNALSSATDTAVLYIQLGDLPVFRFEIPKNTDYDAIWEVASNFWYFPTYNDVLYTGSDANPDLIQFLNTFCTKMSAAYEQAAGTDETFKSEALLQIINSDEELYLLYNQYLLLMEHTGGIRTVDWQQIDPVSSWFSQLILAQNVNDGIAYADGIIDAADSLSPVVHDFFGDFVGDSYDDTMTIVGGILDLFS